MNGQSGHENYSRTCRKELTIKKFPEMQKRKKSDGSINGWNKRISPRQDKWTKDHDKRHTRDADQKA